MLIACVAAAALLLLVQVRSSQYYDTSTGGSYEWSRAYPQSCACREDGATRYNCKYFGCSCACDVTANVCDYNCCCDPDCSDSAISRFESLGACSFEGNSASSYPVCYSSLDLERVNPRGSELGGQSTAQEAVGRALCVEVKNTAHKGFYYTTVELQDSAIFTTSNGQKDFDYSIDVITSLTPDIYYDQNDTIPVYYNVSSTDYYPGSNNGLFSIPVSNNLDGTCVDNYVKFEVSTTEPSKCTRSFSDADVFAAMCESELSMDNYVNNLYLARNAHLTDYTKVTSSEVAVVEISTVYYVDYLTGAETDVTSSWKSDGCDTAYETGSTYALLTDCAYSSDLQTATYTDHDICQGMVVGVTYYIVHDSANSFNISAVTADVYISDVPYSVNSTSTVVTQYFEVQFSSVDDYNSKSNSLNGNEVTRARSGNPGYLQGKPVLYGYDNSPVDELITGLTIPSSLKSYDDSASFLFGTSSCPVSTTSVYMQAVQFGYDSQSGCTVSISREELKAMCCQGSSTGCTSTVTSDYVDSDGVPYIFDGPLSEENALVGYYGNADPLDSTQWFSFDVGSWSDTREWIEDTGTCQNMPSSLVYNFLVAKSGEKANPQNKIVAASSSVETSNWVWRLPHDSTSTQTFQFTVTTTFVYTDKNQLTGYLPPAPPVLFEVPYDVFYPFLSSSASSRSVFNTILAVSSIIVTMIIIV